MSIKEDVFGKLPREDADTSFLMGKSTGDDAKTYWLGNGIDVKPIAAVAIGGVVIAAAILIGGANLGFLAMLAVALVALGAQLKSNKAVREEIAAKRKAEADAKAKEPTAEVPA